MNRLKQKLGLQKFVAGPFLKLPAPAVVEIVGIAGFDYAIIDCEHGPLNVLAAEDMVRAAHLAGISAVVRVTENNPAMISRALDIGADAVQVPQICSRRDAEMAVKAAKFAPMGERGVCRFVRAAEYSAMDKSDYFKRANEETMVIVHIEGQEGIDNLDEILEVEGIDIIFIGPYDLSQSLGVPGQVNHPIVEEKMIEVVRKAKNSGKYVGTFVDDVKTGHKWIELGVQYISYSVDVGIIYDACKRVVEDLYKGR
ncbi:MAG: aldolase/citrate lyase family protein [Bacillota bacterium]|nr:aldolase/citrate lyase family protein [Bacillota bacterium]